MTPKNYGKGTPAKVAAFLRGQDEPLSVAEIHAAMIAGQRAPKLTRRNVFDAMPVLLAAGKVKRHGRWNLYRYTSTDGKGDG